MRTPANLCGMCQVQMHAKAEKKIGTVQPGRGAEGLCPIRKCLECGPAEQRERASQTV